METEMASMYEEGMRGGKGNLKQLKSKMTLDFAGSKPKKLNGLLSSPDLNICTLASPELERIIIQQNGMVTTTPTPTQFLFPRTVTEEQEAYARGFVDALEELHKSQEPGTVNNGDLDVTMTTLQPVQAMQPGMNAVSVAQSQHHQHMPSNNSVYTTIVSSLANTSVQSSMPMPTVVSNQQEYVTSSLDLSRTSSPMMHQTQEPSNRVMQLKEEPQTVPSYNTPPMSPINLDHQERIKLDRKRARNRLAARKCRFRKLERISRLEDRVKDLMGQKNDLASNATQLREQVARLKQQIMEHVNSGCQVMLNSNVL